MYCENSSTTEKKRTGKTKANSKQQNQGGVKPVRRSWARESPDLRKVWCKEGGGGGEQGGLVPRGPCPLSDTNAHMHRTQTKT